jgi:hypothetical protein
MSVEMRWDITAIPWDLYRQRQLLHTPHLFAPGIAGLTEKTFPPPVAADRQGVSHRSGSDAASTGDKGGADCRGHREGAVSHV